MEIEIISFGKISEFIPRQKIDITGISDTDTLKVHLEKAFPQISTMKYKLALNEKLVQNNTLISGNEVVAIMPPFSGG
ncbi:MoaD/ThiS family protein [Pedobacter gandavensis]|uniref:MoaD/ThiS family protein n=1 Tax=Pedobacter TaxID=84567 RepID=UPI002246AE83|nr:MULTISPECIES: MoaD/ThiS family protein [Pedobacter]MCX2452271.1 MoaD/ThiS family protein [Pedobacter sp. PLR]WGQ09869.1 MoaD/ThiS family protein [Pedobacter gandavensis]